MLKTVCDGCRKDLNERLNHVTITGENVSGLLGAGLPAPGQPFHWCNACSIFVFKTIKEHCAQPGV